MLSFLNRCLWLYLRMDSYMLPFCSLLTEQSSESVLLSNYTMEVPTCQDCLQEII